VRRKHASMHFQRAFLGGTCIITLDWIVRDRLYIIGRLTASTLQLSPSIRMYIK